MVFFSLFVDKYTGELVRIYANKIAEIRKSMFTDLAETAKYHSSMMLIFDENEKIVDRCFISYAAGGYTYLYHTTTSGNFERTYRSYHPVEKLTPYLHGEDRDTEWIELPTLKGKQVCMIGGGCYS